jgi:hypothetical protein
MMFNIGGQNWKSFDDDECTDTPYGTFGGKRSFTWYKPGENDELGSSPSGFSGGMNVSLPNQGKSS